VDTCAGESTSERLLNAAAAEFNENGFGGTDTNKIARRAGFAPQTFYRWFCDKVDIFIQVYDRWCREQFSAIDRSFAKSKSDTRLAETVVAHHKAHLVFRRSLRQLAVENDTVRAARAKSRLDQIAFMKTMVSTPPRPDTVLAAMLLQIERLADALAEGEFLDMGLDQSAARTALRRLIHDFRTPG
jgi:AcrR family transcriptional regulator